MAQYLTLAILMALPCAGALAQSGADPTRPPDAILAPAPAAVAAGAAGAGPVAAPRPLLQSIMISADHAEALIGGKLVREGDQAVMGKVVRISESEVTIRTNAGLQTLKLFPGIEKRYAAAQLSAVPVKRNQAKTQ